MDPFQDGRIGFNQVVMERVREEPPSSIGEFLGLAAKKSPIDAAAVIVWRLPRVGSQEVTTGAAASQTSAFRRAPHRCRLRALVKTVRVLAAESAQA
ncbi:MAG: hypothetical protein ACR2H2_15310 [Solirubrobacteraceae bacterium]